MEKIICYKEGAIKSLVSIINGLKMPILDNSENLVKIKEILESGLYGRIEEGGGESGVEQQAVRKD